MFVLGQCMNDIDILPSPFNRWQKPIKWSTSLENGSYYRKTQFSFGATLIGLGFFFSTLPQLERQKSRDPLGLKADLDQH